MADGKRRRGTPIHGRRPKTLRDMLVRVPLPPTPPIPPPPSKPFIDPVHCSGYRSNLGELCLRGCGGPPGLLQAAGRAAAQPAFITASAHLPHERAASLAHHKPLRQPHRLEDQRLSTTELTTLSPKRAAVGSRCHLATHTTRLHTHPTYLHGAVVSRQTGDQTAPNTRPARQVHPSPLPL
jgi:hypothetical protein